MDAVAYNSVGLAAFIEYTLRSDSGTTDLVACSDREHFLQQLLRSANAAETKSRLAQANIAEADEAKLVETIGTDRAEEQDESVVVSHPSQRVSEIGAAAAPELSCQTTSPRFSHTDETEVSDTRSSLECRLSKSHAARTCSALLLTTTLRLLSNSRNVNVAFCNTPSLLQAYLSTLSRDDDRGDTSSTHTRTLAVVGAVESHRKSGLLSAQALADTFACAVEAASLAKRRLLVVEDSDFDPFHVPDTARTLSESADEPSEEMCGNEAVSDEAPWIGVPNPWDARLPILGSYHSSRRFASAGGSSVRKIRIRDVVKKWCRFEDFLCEKTAKL